jgi:hypothetical protein
MPLARFARSTAQPRLFRPRIILLLSSDVASKSAGMVKSCFLILVLGAMTLQAETLPPELAATLKDFRADGPKGWGYTQTTAAGAESLEEHFDPAAPDFQRWTLVRKNGRAPTTDDLVAYNEGNPSRSAPFIAPRLQDQLDPATAMPVGTEGENSTWRFRLQPGGLDDRTAAFMAVTLIFHQPTRTIEQVEIASTGPFSPVFGVRITETRTQMDYSLPTAERPSLLLRVTLHVRGRAFWFKSLDQDMTVTYSDYSYRFKKQVPATSPAP